MNKYMPEVGEECEWKGLKGGFWVKSELIAINDMQVVLLHKDNNYKDGEYEIMPLHCIEFRPLKTEAEKHRDEQIALIQESLWDIDKFKFQEDRGKYEPHELFDAGFRIGSEWREPKLEWSKTLCGGEKVTYEEAEKACAELGEGWRLPTREELESILDLSRHEPAIDTDKFPDTKSSWYWTSTETACNTSAVWIVDFGDGDVDHDRRYDLACVRAVRETNNA